MGPPEDNLDEDFIEESRSFEVGPALSYSWQAVKAHLTPLIIIMAISLIVGAGLVYVQFTLVPFQGLGPFFRQLLLARGLSLEGTLLGLFLVAYMGWGVMVQGLVGRIALAHIEGMKLTTSEALSPRGLTKPVQVAVLVTLPTILSLLVPALGSAVRALHIVFALLGILLLVVQVAVFFMSCFAVFFASKRMSADKGLRYSVRLCSKRTKKVLLLSLVSIGLFLLGLLLAGVGLILTVPLLVFTQAYAFKTLRKRPVAVWK